MAPRPTLTGISVCSGVGMLDVGVELASELLGWSYCPVLYVEREAFSASNLAQAMEDGLLGAAPIWSDLRSVGGPVCRRAVRAALGDDPPGILHGGIPCQPWSSAGRRAGVADPRDLWPAAARAVRRYRPRIVYIENVADMLGATGGADRILGDLEGVGYTTAAAVLSSRAMGASHQRQRLWIMGVLGGLDRGDGSAGRIHPRRGRAGEGAVGGGRAGAEGLQQSPALLRVPGRPELAHGSCRERARVAGEPHGLELGRGRAPVARYAPAGDDWTAWESIARARPDLLPARGPAATQSEVRRVADGVASRVDRLRAIGNGVDPVAAAIAFLDLYASITACRPGDQGLEL